MLLCGSSTCGKKSKLRKKRKNKIVLSWAGSEETDLSTGGNFVRGRGKKEVALVPRRGSRQTSVTSRRPDRLS